jgi:general secretion pathway protein A
VPPGAPPPGALPPLASIESLLGGFAQETDTDNAFNKLFALWGARYLVGRVDACSQAVTQGLECFARRGTLADLRLFNRPAILPITDMQGRTHQVVLAGLDDDRATLSLGGAPRSVSVGELSRLWFGDFVLLWRPGTPEAKTLSYGMRGPDVARLRRGLQQLRGIPPGPDNPVYDAELVRLVEDFQRQQRMTVDGVAGLQTLLVIDSRLAVPGTPRLDAPALALASRGG